MADKSYWDPSSRSPREWFTVATIAFALAAVFLVIRWTGTGGAWILPGALSVIGVINLVQGVRARR